MYIKEAESKYRNSLRRREGGLMQSRTNSNSNFTQVKEANIMYYIKV